MADYTAYFNGEWVPFSQVKIDPLDRGFLGSDVVFDVARTFNGTSFRMQEHIDRLYRSLKYVRMDSGLSSEEMLDISEEVIRRNEHLRAEVGDYGVWQVVTRGVGHSSPGYGAPSLYGTPTVFVRVAPIAFGGFARLYGEGAHGVITRTRSYPPEALEPKVKHYNRMNMTLARMEAADVDPEAWPILTDSHGNITEGWTNSVFLVTDGVIRTPGDRNILQGVSRAMAMDLARQLGIRVIEEDLQPYDLYTADEAFFTSTSPCMIPATKVDNRQVADGKPGPITQQLLAAWSETVGVDIVDQALRFGRG